MLTLIIKKELFVLPDLGVVSAKQWPAGEAGTVLMPACLHTSICPDCSSYGESALVLQSPDLGRARSGGMQCVDTWRGHYFCDVLRVRSLPTQSHREEGRV